MRDTGCRTQPLVCSGASFGLPSWLFPVYSLGFCTVDGGVLPTSCDVGRLYPLMQHVANNHLLRCYFFALWRGFGGVLGLLAYTPRVLLSRRGFRLGGTHRQNAALCSQALGGKGYTSISLGSWGRHVKLLGYRGLVPARDTPVRPNPARLTTVVSNASVC